MKRVVSKRFADADLAEGRFINVEDGAKRTYDHDTRWSDPRDVPGQNYGVYADADDQLVVLDVDDHTGGDKDVSRRGLVGLGLLPPTLRFTSPHTEGADDKPDGHNVYRLAGDETPAELFKREFGKANPVPTWGEVIAKNKFIVGAGSQLDGCKKDWCDDCATDGGGRYAVKDDREIATVDPEALVEALSADPDLGEPASRENQTLDEAADSNSDGKGETPEYDDLRRGTVEEMLSKIPGNQHFDDWIRTGYAVYDWDDSSTGKEVFEEWSRTNQKWEETDSQRQIDYIWNNGEDGSSESKASVGTLVYLAKKNGWRSSGQTAGGESGGDASSLSWEQVRSAYERPRDITPDKFARKMAADLLLEKNDYATPKDTEELYEYHKPSGVYERGGEPSVKGTLRAELGAHCSNSEINEIVAAVKEQTYIDRDDFDGGDDENLLCVENGVLDLETRELLEHSPDYYFTRALPVKFDPDADAAAFEEFLDTITGRKPDKLAMLEMVGATLWPRYLKGKFMILFGEGSNGKSVFFDAVTEFLGPENVSGWDLQDLAENRFATSSLPGKYANIGGDMDSAKLHNTGKLKKLTGNDPDMVEEKGQPAFEFVNSATLMFGANRPPAIDEANRAIARRLVPIHLPLEFTDEDDENPDARDRDDLLAELTDAEELSGLLNLALDGLDRLREQGDVSLPEGHMERLELYESFSDPIKAFAMRCLKNERGKRVKKDSVYNAYAAFCRENDYVTKTRAVFFRALSRTSFDANSVRAGTDGDRTMMLDDATYTEAGQKYRPDYEQSDTADADTDDEPDTETDSSTAAFDGLDKGFADVENVTVAEILDAPDWLQGKGHVVDEDGTILPYECEGADPLADVHEGDTVALQNVKVEDRKAGLTLVLSGVTSVENTTRAAGQSGLDSADAAADGGTETPAEDDSADVSGAYAQVKEHLRVNYETDDTVSAAELAGAGVVPPQTAVDVLEKIATEESLLTPAESDGSDAYRLL